MEKNLSELLEKRPPYVDMSSREREAYLSQINIFTELEYLLFNTLCNSWKPRIQWHDFVIKNGIADKQIVPQLKALCSKLTQSGIGVLLYENEEPTEIILMDAKGPAFYYYFLLLRYQEIRQEITLPFPMLTDYNFSSKVTEYMEHLSFEKLVMHADSDENAEQNTPPMIYMLDTYQQKMIFSSVDCGMVIELAYRKLHEYFTETNVAPVLKEVLKTSDFEKVMNGIDARDPEVWLEVSGALLDSTEKFIEVQPLPNDNYLPVAYLVRRVARCFIDKINQEKLIEQKTFEQMQEIVKVILHYPEKIMPIKKYNALIAQYSKEWGDNFEKWKDFFKETFCVSFSDSQLGRLYLFKEGVIHRRNIYQYLMDTLKNVTPKLHDKYATILYDSIVERRWRANAIFSSPKTLEHDLQQRLKNGEILMWELLNNIQLLSAAIALSMKQQVQGVQTAILRKKMLIFFRENCREVKSAIDIFDISFLKILKKAFRRLSFFQRVITRLLGDYKKIHDHFAQLEDQIGKVMLYVDKAEHPKKKEKPLIKKSHISSRKRKKTLSASEFTHAKVKQYSDRDREAAWKKFENIVSKKD